TCDDRFRPPRAYPIVDGGILNAKRRQSSWHSKRTNPSFVHRREQCSRAQAARWLTPYEASDRSTIVVSLTLAVERMARATSREVSRLNHTSRAPRIASANANGMT